MKTTVLGIRLNEYQREKLQDIAAKRGIKEVDLVREQVDVIIDGKIDVSGLKRQAELRNVSTQTLIDAIVEQLDESSRVKRK